MSGGSLFVRLLWACMAARSSQGRITYLLRFVLSAVAVAGLVVFFVSETCLLCSKAIYTMYGADICAFGLHSLFSELFSACPLVVLMEKCMVCYKPEPVIR